MIRYMTVERIDRSKSNNGSKLLSLPFAIESFENFNKLSIPKYKKLLILAEQYILAKSIDDMMYQDNDELTKFLMLLKNEAQSSLDTLQLDIDQDIYSSYKAGVGSLLQDFTISPALLSMFEDYSLYPANERLLPKEYWKPFLEVSIGKHSGISYNYNNAIMLYPTRVNDVVVFKAMEGTCKYNKDVPNASLNKQLNYLLHFDWNHTNWLSLLGVVSSYCIDNNISKIKSNKSLSHFLKAVTEQNTSTMVNYSEVKYQLFTILENNIETLYKLPRKQIVSIAYLLEKLNLSKDIVNAVSSNTPTRRDIMHLSNTRDLEFLKNLVVMRATEAADDLDNIDEDADEDDAFTTDATMDTSDPFSDSDFGDDSNDSMMDGDLGDTSSMFGDDTGFGDDSDPFGDDFGGDSSSSNAPKPKENTVDVPDSPFTMVLKVVNSETFDDYLVRNAAISAINAILIDPPSTLSGEDLKFLRIWVTQWINFFPIESTKSMLSKLAVYLTDVE